LAAKQAAASVFSVPQSEHSGYKPVLPC